LSSLTNTGEMKNMNLTLFTSRSILMIVLTMVFISLSAQEEQGNKNFKPRSGQAGKDVVWVPTPQALVDKMLDMAKVTPKDFVIDLGSGDGRTVITAAKRGARARGIEYNPNMVELSKKNAAEEGVSDRTEFIQEDLFESDFSDATVITMFLLSSINLRLRPKILELKPGTRIVSNTFDMEEWAPDETATLTDNCDSWCDALMWIVPAKVEGTWKFANGSLKLSQKFQMVSGTLKKGSKTTEISGGRLYGDQLTFAANGEKYSGRVNGNNIEGIVASGQSNNKWVATRTAD
jgi:SAM-dependent methyltransferase